MLKSLVLAEVVVRDGLAGIRRITSGDTGASAVEYALMVGLIAVVIIAGVTALGSALNGKFNTVSSSI